MIDLQAYRLAIGMFRFRVKCKQKSSDFKCDDDANAMGIALICTLLVIGGLELNPGPSTTADYEQPGPSFVDASIMDVMQAIRILQLHLDQLSQQLRVLTSQVGELTFSQRVNHCDRVPEAGHAQFRTNSTDKGHQHDTANQLINVNPNAEQNINDSHAQNPAPKKARMRTNGAILIGSENVHRIRAAALT